MAETKTFASLSSGLLARKGAAKPAMRPQGFGAFVPHIEDLGWNDMGQEEEPEHVPSSIEALTPIGGRPAAPPAATQEPPAVLEQQRAIEESFTPELEYEPEPEPEPEPDTAFEPEPQPPEAEIVSLPPRRPVRVTAPAPVAAVLPARAKAAFTLRLDPARHLKLRLACAVTRRSAQQLVTGALDEFLNTLPEVEAMADRLPAEAGQRSR
jgi:hypothetical protein